MKIQHSPDIGFLFLSVRRFRVLFEHLVIPPLCGFLQQMNCQRIIQMAVCAASHFMAAPAFQRQVCFQPQRVIGTGMKSVHILLNIF